jgi:formiminotetrahydrofolate cyclodeaminase
MDFINRVASFSPVPAGGAAVANSFCLAIALIYKVVLFETERNYHNFEMGQNLLTAKKEIEKLLRDAERLVDEDSESYIKFAESRREGNKTQMKQYFNDIIEVSMKVMEKSDAGFQWIDQLHKIIPNQMATHLLVASELLMGSINGTVHVVKDNLRALKSSERRENYFSRLNELHTGYKELYREVVEKLSQLQKIAYNASGEEFNSAPVIDHNDI